MHCPSRVAAVAAGALALCALSAFAQDDAARRNLTVVAGQGAGGAASQGPVDVPPRTVGEVLALLDQYRPDPAKAAALRAALEKAPPQNADKVDLVRFRLERARVAETLGLSSERVADLREAAKLAAGTAEEARMVVTLGIALMQQGEFSAVVRLYEGLLADMKGPPGPAVPVYFHLARIHAYQGDVGAMQSAYQRGNGLFEKLRNLPPLRTFVARWSALRETARTDMAQAQGRLAEAEAAARNAVALWQQVTSGDLALQADESGTSEETYFQAQSFLVRVLTREGKLREAELVARNALRELLQRTGKYSTRTGYLVTQYANLLAEQGRFAEARAMADAALEILEASGTPERSSFRGFALMAKADALLGAGDWQGADRAYRSVRAGVAGDEVSEQLFRGTSASGLAQVKAGAPAEALPALRRLAEQMIRNLGADHPSTGEVRGVYAMALAGTGDRAAALREYREAVRVLFAPGAAATQLTGLALRRVKVRQIVESYLALLGEVRGSDIERTAQIDAAAEAFRIADGLRGGSVQQALAASAARAAANQPALGELIRREQDERQEIAMLYDHVLRLMSLPEAQQLPKIVAEMRARIAALEKSRQQLYADIERRFPDYASLADPRPATIEEARRALKPGEALVSVLSTAERSFVWAVNAKGEVSFHAAALSEKDIAAIVAALRRSLDPGQLDFATLPPFDTGAAYRLYAALFAPGERVWGSADTMIASVGGALAQIPLAILPTQSVTLRKSSLLFGEFRDVPWLAKRVAIADVPSVSAFVRLRALPAASRERAAFAGFGDPLFGKLAPVLAQGTRGVHLRNLDIVRIEQDAGLKQTPDWTQYANVTPLPDTREELLAIAQALGADPGRDVFLGGEANKRRVKAENLAGRRIVAFATHGLIPGDLPGLDQPALALAALDDPKESPLLMLDDVLGLKLNADWVVLSACNTAAGDGQGAEAVSGLGRGFFYAGTRALLVTHWPVETVSAKMLTTTLFQRYAAKDANLTRAHALRASILSLMDSQTPDYSYAHPLFWAPYALIGDAGR